MENLRNLFRQCETLEELKKLYRKLAMKYHPDHGGDGEKMKEINDLYERFFDSLKESNNRKANANAKGFTHTEEKSQEFIEIINKLINLNGLIIDVCGQWIWLTGNTYSYKDIIKELGFYYSKNKKAWYKDMTGKPKTRKRGFYSMKQIYQKYGRETLETEEKLIKGC